MERDEILKTITETMEVIFGRKPLTVTESTKAADIEEWDSLSLLDIVVTLEKHYKVKFANKEIHNWKNVGDMCTAVQNKLKAA